MFDSIADDTKNFEDVINDFFIGIAEAFRRAISEMIAYQLMLKAFGSGFAQGDLGGWIGKGVGALAGAFMGEETSEMLQDRCHLDQLDMLK